MIAIKTNYNNAFVKKPYKITPSVRFFKTTENGIRYLYFNFNSNIPVDSDYENYFFEIYINDEFITTITKSSEQPFKYTDDSLFYERQFVVKISGYYINSAGKKYTFVKEETINNAVYCGENIACSENLTAIDFD